MRCFHSPLSLSAYHWVWLTEEAQSSCEVVVIAVMMSSGWQLGWQLGTVLSGKEEGQKQASPRLGTQGQEAS